MANRSVAKKKNKFRGASEEQSVKTATPSISKEKIEAEVKQRAKEIYLKRGKGPGTELSDWLQAEKEIKAKYGIAG